MYLLYILRVLEIFLFYEKLSVKRDAFAVTIMHNEDIWFLL